MRYLHILLGLALLQYSQAQNCTEQCCYWYKSVPGNNSECVVGHDQTAYLRCVVIMPHDVNNNSVGTVRWYRSLDLVTSEDVTDEYEATISLSSLPVVYGFLTGLFQDTYSLIIHNISSSDSGHYWCQIITNETCLSPSAYVNISVSTVSTDNGCSSVNYRRNPVCATNTTCNRNELTAPVTIAPVTVITEQTSVTDDLHTVNYSSTSQLVTNNNPSICDSRSTPSISALVGSLLSIIALLAFTLLLTIIIFVVAWKKKRQCEKCKNAVFTELPSVTVSGVPPNGKDPSKEYEDPDYCLPGNGGLSVRTAAPNKDSGAQSYETIDIMKVDYVSVYSSLSKDGIQNKT